MSSNSNDVRLIEESPKKKRKIITVEARAVIVNVYKFLKEEYLFTMMHKDCKCDLSHLRNISRRTADATNVSLRTVAQILREHRQTNALKVDNKVYRFKKAKSSQNIVADPDKLRQELESMEAATLAEADSEDLSQGEVELTLEPVKVKKEVEDNTVMTRQPTEVKNEVEAEVEITWKEAEFKTEVEKESSLEDIYVKEESDDYEITIKEER